MGLDYVRKVIALSTAAELKDEQGRLAQPLFGVFLS